VTIDDGSVVVAGDEGERPSPSVDLLLSTAAREYGERLVAVILTGSGHDGAAGAVDVKGAGGVVVIQNPATAAYPAMPMALPPTATTNEELQATNEELHARTCELQELNRVLAGERRRLSEMVELAPFHIAVLRGSTLSVEAANSASLQLFKVEDALGRPFEEVCRGPAFEPLLQGAREAFRRDRPWNSARIATPVERPGAEPAVRELVYTVVPTHDAGGGGRCHREARARGA
jgi:hypothetical protein